jgi:hypothetical protein
MKKILILAMLTGSCVLASAQDSNITTSSTSTSTSTVNTTNVNSGTITNNNNTNVISTSTNNNISTSVNTNNNVNSGTLTNNNNNITSGSMTYTNNNVNSGEVTNRNINDTTASTINSNSNTNVNQNINSGDVTNRNINDTFITQKVIQPPPTAIAPAMMSGGNADLCTTGTSGSVQTQIFGVSGGGTVRDLNCERLKLSKTLYDMGMKVAAVATMCQDRRVWDAMVAAGTPCPYEGKIGTEAKAAWDANPQKLPKLETEAKDDTYKKLGIGALLGAIIFKAF